MTVTVVVVTVGGGLKGWWWRGVGAGLRADRPADGQGPSTTNQIQIQTHFISKLDSNPKPPPMQFKIQIQRYDAIHNAHLALAPLRELYATSRALAAVVVPHEYGEG